MSDYFSARAATVGADAVSTPSPIADDASLWREITSAEDLKRFSHAWLAILARSSNNILRACVLFGEEKGRLTPIAVWAKTGVAIQPDALVTSADAILTAILDTRQPAIEAADGTARSIHAGVPFVIDKTVHGLILVEAEIGDAASSRRLIRHLQWGSAWVEAFIRRQSGRSGEVVVQRAGTLIDILNAVASQARFATACQAFAGELAKALKADRVAVGHRDGHSTHLAAMLQTATFERKYNVTRAIEAAMDEAIDQKIALTSPVMGHAGHAAIAQDQLARLSGATAVLTVPMFRNGREIGAATLERFSIGAFTDEDVELCEALCAVVGPVLSDKKDNDRTIFVLAAQRVRQWMVELLGPQRLGLKLASLLAAIGVLILIFASDTYNVHARAQMQGEVRRVLSAPFDGYIRAQYLRAGQVAEEGGVLAEMQDNDLVLDRLRHVAQRNQYRLELDRALARRDLAQANVTRAQIEQKDSEIDLVDQMLARTQIRAPFASVIVSGDLSQSVGKPVSRGDTLFELAPLDKYRVTLVVPELEMQSVRPGQRGHVLLSALPEQPFAFVVTTVTPISHVQDGVNGFEVHAVLSDQDSRVRPGMEGVAKIEIGKRNLAWIWGHGLVYWLRIKLWALIP